MVNKITTVAVIITTVSTVYLGVRVHVLETEVDKAAALAVEKFERDLFAREAAMARAQQYAAWQAELNQRAVISRDLRSIPGVLLEGR